METNRVISVCFPSFTMPNLLSLGYCGADFGLFQFPIFFYLLYCQTCFKITSFSIAEALTPQVFLAPSELTLHGKAQALLCFFCLLWKQQA